MSSIWIIILISVIIFIILFSIIYMLLTNRKMNLKVKGGSRQDFSKTYGGFLTISVTNFNNEFFQFKSGMIGRKGANIDALINELLASTNIEMSSKSALVAAFRNWGNTRNIDIDDYTKYYTVICEKDIGPKEYILNSTVCIILSTCFPNLENYSDQNLKKLLGITNNTSEHISTFTKQTIQYDNGLPKWTYNNAEHYICSLDNANRLNKYATMLNSYINNADILLRKIALLDLNQFNLVRDGDKIKADDDTNMNKLRSYITSTANRFIKSVKGVFY